MQQAVALVIVQHLLVIIGQAQVQVQMQVRILLAVMQNVPIRKQANTLQATAARVPQAVPKVIVPIQQ